MAAVEHLVAHPEIAHGPIRDRLHAGRGGRTRRGSLRRRRVRRGVRLHARRRRRRRARIRELLRRRDDRDVQGLQHASRATPGAGWSTRSSSPPTSSPRCRKDGLSPETTAGYDGYVHPYQVDASVDRTSVRVLLRDFVTGGLADKAALVERLAREAMADEPRASVDVRRRTVLPQHARGARPRARRDRSRAAGDPTDRARADRKADPRRHRRIALVVHGTADAESLHRRTQLPLAPGVDVDEASWSSPSRPSSRCAACGRRTIGDVDGRETDDPARLLPALGVRPSRSGVR